MQTLQSESKSLGLCLSSHFLGRLIVSNHLGLVKMCELEGQSWNLDKLVGVLWLQNKNVLTTLSQARGRLSLLMS